MNCEIFRETLGSYLDETLDEDRRQWFRRHLRECDSCRDAAVKEEPSLLFAVAPAMQSAPEAIEACAASVTAQIRQDRLERRLHKRSRPWMAAAAAVVVLIGGGLVWRTTIGGGGGILPRAVEASRDLGAQNSPPTVEVETQDAEVRVYRFATEGDSDTAVYFIVDPALEL